MSINIGETSIENIYVGDQRITAIYVGTTLVFGAETMFLITHGNDFLVDHLGNFLIA